MVDTAVETLLPPSTVVFGNEVWVLSGKDGQTLRKTSSSFGVPSAIAAAGDMDQDGIGDYAVQWLKHGSSYTVEVLSGVDDRRIWVEQREFGGGVGFGNSLLGGIDTDGDGLPNLVTTEHRGSPTGRVYVFASDGALRYTITGTSELGIGVQPTRYTLDSVGDVDLDGCDDFVVGGALYSEGKGAAVVISGRDGAVLTYGVDEALGDAIGYAVAGCGDVDGDGVPDFVAGGSPPFGRGSVQVFSTASGERLHVWSATTVPGNGFSGSSVRSGGIDLDRDGIGDVLVGSSDFSGGLGGFFAFSGRDWSELMRVAPLGQTFVGDGIAAMGPVPGTPFPAFAITEPKFGSGGFLLAQGRVSVYAGPASGAAPLGPGCTGTLAAQPEMGLSDLGASGIRLHLSSAPPGAAAALLVGLSSTSWLGGTLPLPLSSIGFPGCELATSSEIQVPVLTGTTGTSRGYASFDVPFALRTGFGTLALHGQWLVLGSGATAPGATSDSLSWSH